MSLEKEFVPYQLSLDMKKLGFDEPCLAYYFHSEFSYWIMNSSSEYKHCANEYFNNNEVSAPLYQQAFRWFREKHNLEGEVHCIRFNSKRLKGYQYAITSRNYQKFEQLGDYHTYEEAELACLVKLIDIVKKQNLKG